MQIKVSSKYQVVIPREFREALDIKPGTRIEVFSYGDRLEFVPVRDVRSMRGFVKGIDTTVERDGDRV